jgi:predicted CXXCH cytochrome family protein
VWPGSGYTGGDCKNCHDVHGTANTYDVLRGTYTQANFGTCFTCHNGTVTGAANIARWYPASSGGTASNATVRYGHKSVEAGTLPAGSPMPCYVCHNPHGSANSYGLQLITQLTPGTPLAITTFGAGSYSPSTAAQVRNLCFACHIPTDTSNGWNGTAYAAVSVGARVEGLDRLASLKLSNRATHRQDSATSCYSCHINAHYPAR